MQAVFSIGNGKVSHVRNFLEMQRISDLTDIVLRANDTMQQIGITKALDIIKYLITIRGGIQFKEDSISYGSITINTLNAMGQPHIYIGEFVELVKELYLTNTHIC